MKTCKTELCQSTDIEPGRRICRDCKRAQMALKATERRNQDREKYNANMRKFRKTHPIDKDQESARQADKYLRYKNKINKRNSKWRKENPELVASARARYRAAQLLRTPKWLNDVQLNAIQEFYNMAKDLTKKLGNQYEVDHIVPIKGKNVSGLRVPWNLQVLPKFGPKGNRSKNNKF